MSAERSLVAHHVLFALLGVALIALGVRLFVFQQSGRAEMVHRAEVQQRIVITIPARRGKIYANSHSMMVPLAASRRVPSCFADPVYMSEADLRPASEAVAGVLGLSADEVHRRLVRRRTAGSKFIWLARELDDDVARRIGLLKLPGVGIQQEWRRYYPNGTLAAHVVGFAGRDGRGLEGVELLADTHLRATDGRREARCDAARRPIWNAPGTYLPPQDGRHVLLTIDVVIQRHLQQALAEAVHRYNAESGIGLVVEPSTGDVIALAGVPTYDLNAYGKATQQQRRCRAVTDPYEPGSVFKPFVASVALAAGKVRMGEELFCHNGAYRCRRGRTLHDAHPYGTLTFEQVVYKSSNIGMAQIGQRMGDDLLHEAVTAFGFGAKSGIELGGEDPGLVHPLPRWTVDSKWSIPMGQEVSVTAVQLVMAFAALGNDGLLLKPRLIRRIYAPDGQVVLDNSAPQPVRQVIAPEVCRQFVREVLARVPTREGTGRRGELDGWSSFGKTGTAQISPYGSGQYTASYIAAAPVDRSRLVCLISVRKPDRAVGYYGGTVAAPAVKEVLEKSLAYLGVPRDAG